jgi:hypothetical protein
VLHLLLESTKEKGVTYQISFIGCKKVKAEPEEFMSFKGDKVTFELANDLLFVRCKITSSKLQNNPVEDLAYETAWTQPIMSNESDN